MKRGSGIRKWKTKRGPEKNAEKRKRRRLRQGIWNPFGYSIFNEQASNQLARLSKTGH